MCASWVEVARVAVARGPAGESARLLRVVELGARSRHALRVALVGHFLRSAMRRSCGSAGGQATGCVAGRSRCSVGVQGGCRSVCTSRVRSAVSGAVAAAPAAPASRPGCTVPPAGPAPASWRCQSPCRPLRTHNERGMQGEPTPRLGGRARAPRFELCARTVGSTTNERAVDLRGAEVSGRHGCSVRAALSMFYPSLRPPLCSAPLHLCERQRKTLTLSIAQQTLVACSDPSHLNIAEEREL